MTLNVTKLWRYTKKIAWIFLISWLCTIFRFSIISWRFCHKIVPSNVHIHICLCSFYSCWYFREYHLISNLIKRIILLVAIIVFGRQLLNLRRRFFPGRWHCGTLTKTQSTTIVHRGTQDPIFHPGVTNYRKLASLVHGTERLNITIVPIPSNQSHRPSFFILQKLHLNTVE